MLSQMQGQLQSIQELVKEKDGTIETLQRQLVQAGIKMKVGDAKTEIRKDVLETESQQKLLRGMLKVEFDRIKDQMQSDMKKTKEDVSENEQS
jgi:Mg2+ and Co2+ transporter CorA